MPSKKEIQAELVARVLAESVDAVTLRNPSEPVDVSRIHRDLADNIVAALSAAEKEREGERGDAIHVDVCPDCGTADSGHMMDPPPHCPHQRECFVPVRYVPEGREGETRATIERIRAFVQARRDKEYAKTLDSYPEWVLDPVLEFLDDLQEQSTGGDGTSPGEEA